MADFIEEVKMGKAQSHDKEKERQWQKVIREAARSGLSIRQFCRQHRLRESQFYRWQRKLKERGEERRRRRRAPARERSAGEATFALVSDDPGALAAGIELVLSNGRRLRIGKGVDEETLRRVLATLESPGC
jgi:transposase-like protein